MTGLRRPRGHSVQGRLALAFVVLVAALFPATAPADVLIRLDLAALQARAEKSVRARVASVQSAWNSDRSFIFTHVGLDVLEYYKGAGPNAIQVRVPGGKVGNYRIWAVSMPDFAAGEEVLVFLTRWPDGALKVAGYAQGLSRVVPSPRGPILRGGTLDQRSLGDVEPRLRAAGPQP